MYTNVTHEMKYKLHIYMQARAQSVGPLGSFFYSRTKATSVLAQVAVAAFAIGKVAWASLAWVDRANESRASGSSW